MQFVSRSPRVESWKSRIAPIAAGVIAIAAACSAYEPDLLRRHENDQQAAGGVGGAAGSPPAAAGAGAGGAPPDNPGDVTAVACGDGEVALDETCDIAIAQGQPGACPTACPPLVDCVSRVLEGANCKAQCAVLAQLCASGDGCCPADCNHESDGDCSERCGDGIVQEDEGETCEPDADAGPGCTTEEECHDGDDCTADVFTGSEANCNAACSFAPITATAPGDGCCPPDANANLDPDCRPVCGNDVREAGEDCDGSLGCDEQCTLRLTAQQLACLEMVQEAGNDCDRCSCMQCAPQQLACRDSGDELRDMHCTAINACANDNDCVGAWCYCTPGDAFCDDVAGPCKQEIDAAAAADPSGGTVPQQRADPETAIYRAAAIGECNAVNCMDVCP